MNGRNYEYYVISMGDLVMTDVATYWLVISSLPRNIMLTESPAIEKCNCRSTRKCNRTSYIL